MKLGITTALFTLLLAISSASGFSVESKRTRATNSALFRSQTFHSEHRNYFQRNKSQTALDHLHMTGGDGGLKSYPTLAQEMIAEFIGTFIIVQIGCGTVCAAIYKAAQVGLWQIAAVWAIAVTVAISSTAAISGAHLNPAITLAFAAIRDFDWKKVIPFIVAQLSGAIAAAGVNFALFRESIASFEAASSIVRGTAESVKSAAAFGEYWSVSNWITAFFAEAYGTAFLAFIIFALTNEKNETTAKNSFMIPPLIGATVASLISVIAPLTQAGFNPARDFGPRIVALLAGWKGIAMQGWWVYVLAPIVGAPIGAFVADKVLYKND